MEDSGHQGGQGISSHGQQGDTPASMAPHVQETENQSLGSYFPKAMCQPGLVRCQKLRVNTTADKRSQMMHDDRGHSNSSLGT
jgi:hypothetical protein